MTLAIRFAAALSLCAAPAVASAAEKTASRPLVRLSFIAAAHTDAETANAALGSIRSRKGKGGCGYMWLMKCSENGNLFEKTTLGSYFWVPWIHADLERRYGQGSVVLDPVTIIRGSDGELKVRSASDAASAPVQVFVIPYRNPDWDSMYGFAKAPTSTANWVTFSYAVSRNAGGSREGAWNEVVAKFTGRMKEFKVEKAGDWESIAAADPRTTAKAPKPVATLVQKLVSAIDANSVEPAVQVASYEKSLEPNDSTPEPAIFAKFLAAETKFHKARSDLLYAELTEGQLGKIARDFLGSEVKAQQQMMAIGMASLFTMGAGFGAAGSGIAGLATTLKMFQDQRAVQGAQATAFGDALGGQVTLLDEAGQGVTLTAANVDEFRRKMLAMKGRFSGK